MRRRRFYKDKLVIVMVILAVISAGVIVGLTIKQTRSGKGNGKNKDNIIDLNDGSTGNMLDNNESTDNNNKDTTGSQVLDNETTSPGGGSTEEPTNNPADEESTDNKGTDNSQVLEDETTKPNGGNQGQEVDVVINSDVFSRDKVLHWPVSGNVILDFSMDTTIYFPSLDLYKCNSGIMIQSEEGSDVAAAASGTVKSISKNEEIGSYVVIDMGDGYEATYGNLKDICVKAGDKIKMGDTIGKAAAPTKYYSVEGCNIFFEIRENGTPIDPLDYLKY